jgi:hypothetical protein
MLVDLISLLSSDDAPVQRPTGLRLPLSKIVRSIVGSHNKQKSLDDVRLVYPLKIQYAGRAGGIHTLFAPSSETRQEWKDSIEKALRIRKPTQESDQVNTLSILLRHHSSIILRFSSLCLSFLMLLLVQRVIILRHLKKKDL